MLSRLKHRRAAPWRWQADVDYQLPAGGSDRRGHTVREASQAGWPASIPLAWSSLNTRRRAPAAASSGSRRNASWSPAAKRSTMRPTNHVSQSPRIGTLDGPGRQSHLANLSASSPERPPNSAASGAASAERTWTALTIGPVGVREADEKAWGIDARLGAEANEAAGALRARGSGDDEHRIVEHGDEFVEGRVPIGCRSAPVSSSSSTIWSALSVSSEVSPKVGIVGQSCVVAGARRPGSCSVTTSSHTTLKHQP
jgi:hypothetical protein